MITIIIIFGEPHNIFLLTREFFFLFFVYVTVFIIFYGVILLESTRQSEPFRYSIASKLNVFLNYMWLLFVLNAAMLRKMEQSRGGMRGKGAVEP